MSGEPRFAKGNARVARKALACCGRLELGSNADLVQRESEEIPLNA